MAESRLIVALDFAQPREALDLVDRLEPQLCALKVGKELFVAGGPAMVEQLVERGYRVFLDLKFHDIPNTVAAACRAAARLGVWMLNVHASGGAPMLRAAREALDAGSSPRPFLIAVTILTSLSEGDLPSIGLSGKVEDNVRRLALLAQQCGLDGVVCSAQEAPALRQAVARTFKLVTPGIRLTAESSDDQRRVVTPLQAVHMGTDYLVIGRPITRAADPARAARDIHQQLEAEKDSA